MRSFRLVAEVSTISLKPGVTVTAWTYNGAVPGPTLTVRQGDLVRVTLENRLPVGTTIHWHGLTLPNGQDGVGGLTQDPVPPGASAAYAFVANRAGTYWYHSHQDSAVQVDRGLYGALVVRPRVDPHPAATDSTLMLDEWPLALEMRPEPSPGDFAWVSYVFDSVNGRAGSAIAPVRFRPGSTVRLRLVDAGNYVHLVHVDGVPVTVVALDGHEVSGAAPTGDALPIGPGERVDVEFTAPARPLWIHLEDGEPPPADTFVPLIPDGRPIPSPPAGLGAEVSPVLDLLHLSAAAADSPWPAGAAPTRNVTLVLSTAPGTASSPSLDGTLYEIDGQTFPQTPVLEVRLGDLVSLTFVNRSRMDHTMHLHGHFFQVLAVDGRPPPGVLVKDSVVVPGQHSVTVGFRADNPGWWMLHCHELYHSRGGMMMLVRYAGAPRLAEMGGAYGGEPD